jgi:hypothetical protein
MPVECTGRLRRVKCMWCAEEPSYLFIERTSRRPLPAGCAAAHVKH